MYKDALLMIMHVKKKLLARFVGTRRRFAGAQLLLV
jgi:hypothetical protein